MPQVVGLGLGFRVSVGVILGVILVVILGLYLGYTCGEFFCYTLSYTFCRYTFCRYTFDQGMHFAFWGSWNSGLRGFRAASSIDWGRTCPQMMKHTLSFK